MERVYNLSLYLLLLDRDFSFLKLEMVSTFNLPRLLFAARQQALLLYEASDDLSELLGKPFRQSLAALGITETDVGELNAVSKRLNSFKKSNHQFLYNDIRNVAAGHRTQDSLEFLRKVEAIDPIQVFELGAEFFDIVRLLLDFLAKVTVHAGQPLNALRQLLASPKFMASLGTQQSNESPK